MPTAVEDKDAIRELMAEYCFRLDDGHYDDMAALFTRTALGTRPLARQPAAPLSLSSPPRSGRAPAPIGRARRIW